MIKRLMAATAALTTAAVIAVGGVAVAQGGSTQAHKRATHPAVKHATLGNLLENALRHGAHHVVLRAEQHGERLELHVSDDGRIPKRFPRDRVRAILKSRPVEDGRGSRSGAFDRAEHRSRARRGRLYLKR